MFFIDYPYVSDLLKRMFCDEGLPVVATEVAKEFGLCSDTLWMDEEQARRMIAQDEHPRVYTNSETALAWFSRFPECRHVAKNAQVFKDKAAFRRLTKPLFPDFQFCEVSAQDLGSFDFGQITCPCIIKPSIGFFSMGVHKVSNPQQWPDVIECIQGDIDRIRQEYPPEVVSSQSFIIEQCIEGDEFAVDAYFSSTGEPVIVGMYQHVFSSETDVGDRVYSTSSALFETYLEEFTGFLGAIGELAGVKNFPVHIELRKTQAGVLLPIEVNPLRFGGWCTTADMTYLAYGFNAYHAFYHGIKPNWSDLLQGKAGKKFSMIVLDNSTGVAASDIAAFDYDKLLAGFSKPMELRKIDYTRYPVFGFLFVETDAQDDGELDAVLYSSLREFISIK